MSQKVEEEQNTTKFSADLVGQRVSEIEQKAHWSDGALRQQISATIEDRGLVRFFRIVVGRPVEREETFDNLKEMNRSYDKVKDAWVQVKSDKKDKIIGDVWLHEDGKKMRKTVNEDDTGLGYSFQSIIDSLKQRASRVVSYFKSKKAQAFEELVGPVQAEESDPVTVQKEWKTEAVDPVQGDASDMDPETHAPSGDRPVLVLIINNPEMPAVRKVHNAAQAEGASMDSESKAQAIAA